MRKYLSFFLLMGLWGVTGCIDDSTIISVDKAGGGTVVLTTYMSKAAQDMMDKMLGSMGGKTGTSAKKNPVTENMDQYKAKAASMGEGVKFISARNLKKADGSTGVQVTYSFNDISKLRINSEPNMPSGGGNEDTPASGQEVAPKKDNPVTFSFEKGTTSKLTVKLPSESKKPEPGQPEETSTPPMPPTKEQLAQMRLLFGGFRMQMVVKVDGEIISSNATYVERDSKTNKKQIVTLLDMDIGKIIKDEATFNKIASMGQPDDIKTAKEKLKGVPGLKIETAENVTIEFK